MWPVDGNTYGRSPPKFNIKSVINKVTGKIMFLLLINGADTDRSSLLRIKMIFFSEYLSLDFATHNLDGILNKTIVRINQLNGKFKKACGSNMENNDI